MPRRPRTLQACLGRCQGMPRTLPSMPRRPRTLPSMPRSCQASLHILGSHIKRAGTWWYTTPLASQLIRKQVGGFIFDVGLLGPCEKHAEEAEDVASMPRTLQSMPRTLRSMPRTLPSMPRSCQACLGVAKQAYTS